LSPSLNLAVSSLLHPGRAAARLAVTPREPVVPYGGSVQLNCSLSCSGGTVQWKGLDTNLGSVTSFPTHSVLHVNSATVATAGTKICQGTCQGRHYQRTVDLKVYALPDRLWLEAEPSTLAWGQPGILRCSAQGLYPLTGLALTWYRGDRALDNTDFDATETDEQLFDVVSTLPVTREEVGEDVEFRCEVTLSVGQDIFTRVASMAVSAQGESTEQSVAAATSTRSSRTAAATTGSLGTAGPATTTAPPPAPRVPTRDPTTALSSTCHPDADTTSKSAAATEPSSTERSAPRDLITGSPTAQPATTALPGSGSTATAAGSINWGSSPAEKGPEASVGPCSLQIWALPPNGTRGRALRIECHARCGGNATVRWLRTPVALSQYREEAAGSSSTLRLDRAEPQHQGHYQCVLLGRRSQEATLQLMVVDDSLGAGPAIATGTTFSLLGLIVAGAVSRRLWKHFRSQYELP
ncbi:MADCA protein, partial [Todus mexicanus]|nr:MADCA protein [Todus mexicanus]